MNQQQMWAALTEQKALFWSATVVTREVLMGQELPTHAQGKSVIKWAK